jgi:hypothetical protein
MCYGGVQLDPFKKPCTSLVWFTSMIGSKTLLFAAVIAAALYYGWPIIEAVILVLPIPDPKDSIDRVKNAANNASDMVQGALAKSRAPPAINVPGDYSQNLEAQPDAFMEDDDNSDDDIGKNTGLNYDSDEKNDEEQVDTGSGSELIDLGGSSENSKLNQKKSAPKIPKLSGPN